MGNFGQNFGKNPIHWNLKISSNKLLIKVDWQHLEVEYAQNVYSLFQHSTGENVVNEKVLRMLVKHVIFQPMHMKAKMFQKSRST